MKALEIYLKGFFYDC